MMPNPVITIVVVTRGNNPDFTKAAIDSCIAQIDVTSQIIVSTVVGDPSVDIARKLGVELAIDHNPRAHSVRQAFRQLNRALTIIKGEWFASISGNDVWLPTKSIDEIRTCIESKKKVCYSDFLYADMNLSITGTAKFYPFDYAKLLKGNFVCDDSTAEWDLLRRFMPYKEEFNNYAWWDLWLRIAKLEPNTFAYNPKPEWMYRLGPNSRHARKKADKQMQMADMADKFKMLKSHGV